MYFKILTDLFFSDEPVKELHEMKGNKRRELLNSKPLELFYIEEIKTIDINFLMNENIKRNSFRREN